MIEAREFVGLLTYVDRQSDSVPNGARGRRVLIPRDVAKRVLHSLVGQAVNVAASLAAHDVKNPVGRILEARIDDKKIMVRGLLYGDLRWLATDKRLGMSYELADAKVRNMAAPLWTLDDFRFAGAAILEARKAAYQGTRIELGPVMSISEIEWMMRITSGICDGTAAGQNGRS